MDSINHCRFLARQVTLDLLLLTAGEMLTWLMLAAEALAAPCDGLEPSLQVAYATPSAPSVSPPGRFDWLRDLAARITTAVKEEAQRSRMIGRLPQTLASTWGVQTLFRGLFPEFGLLRALSGRTPRC